MKRIVFGFLLCALVADVFGVGLELPALVGDHMVLQRNSKVNIWGWAEPGDRVEVVTGWDGHSYSSRADSEGNWLVRVSTGDAGGPHRIIISADKEIVLKDILLGEVWVCSGQSNMAWTLNRAESARPEIARSKHPEIRLFTVERRISATEQEDVKGRWSVCSPETAAAFSAVGYFFARDLNEELDIPIGMIHSSWGGTPVEAWTSRKTLRTFGVFDRELDMLYSVNDAKIREAEIIRDSLNKKKARLMDFDNPENPGIADAWMQPALPDSSWQELPCPAEWTGLKGLGMNEGVVWLRKKVEIPAEWIGKTLVLELGPIDEMDRTWVNGTEVGSMLKIDNWADDRIYEVPASVVEDNSLLIAIRAVNTFNEGGLFGNPDQLRLYPKKEADSDTLMLAGLWKYRVATEFQPMPILVNSGIPSVLYNGMLAPLTTYTIKGAIWYQGENNVSRAYQYRTLFPGMIEDWRNAWGIGDFPFYFVQLAPYRAGKEHAGAELREAQFLTLGKLPNTGMAVTLDIGNPTNIHPPNKRDVGRRLALWALARDYGEDLVYSGPLFMGFTVEGDTLTVKFDHTGSGLQSIGGPPTHFELAGEDQVYHPAKAVIDGHVVRVISEEVAVPVAVRFAFYNTDEPNLYNMEGLPASSFCSDDWKRTTEK